MTAAAPEGPKHRHTNARAHRGAEEDSWRRSHGRESAARKENKQICCSCIADEAAEASSSRPQEGAEEDHAVEEARQEESS